MRVTMHFFSPQKMLFGSRAFQADLSSLGSLGGTISVSHFLLLFFSVFVRGVSGTSDHNMLLCLRSAFGFGTLVNLGLMPLDGSLSMGSLCSSADPSYDLGRLSMWPHHAYPHPPSTAHQRL